MKKIIFSLVLMLSLLFTFNSVVNASEVTTTAETTSTTTDVEQTTEEELPGAGVKPGDLFYGFDKFFENVALRLTFSDEKKAEKLAKIAEERLAELNELDPEKAEIYADELFNEYGLSLEKAQLFVQKLVAEGKISEEKLEKLEQRVIKAEAKKEKLSEKAKEKISTEIKEKVEETLRNAKMSIFSKFENLDEIKALHEDGYGYGQLLKLQAIAQLSSKTINELLLIENVVSEGEDNEKEINFTLLLESLELTEEQLKEKLTSYRDAAKESMKEKMDQADNRAKEARETIKDKVNEKKNK